MTATDYDLLPLQLLLVVVLLVISRLQTYLVKDVSLFTFYRLAE